MEVGMGRLRGDEGMGCVSFATEGAEETFFGEAAMLEAFVVFASPFSISSAVISLVFFYSPISCR
jgi:hypothetical protein